MTLMLWSRHGDPLYQPGQLPRPHLHRGAHKVLSVRVPDKKFLRRWMAGGPLLGEKQIKTSAAELDGDSSWWMAMTRCLSTIDRY